VSKKIKYGQPKISIRKPKTINIYGHLPDQAHNQCHTLSKLVSLSPKHLASTFLNRAIEKPIRKLKYPKKKDINWVFLG
jgi:hypothetical protein